MSNAIKFTSPVGKMFRTVINGEGFKSKPKAGRKEKPPVYCCSVVVSKEEAAPFIKQIDDYFAENKEKYMKKADCATVGYRNFSVPTEDKDPETGEIVYKETGEIEFFSKTNTTWPDGKIREVSVANSKGRQVQLGDKKVGNGSIGRFSANMSLYNVEGTYGINLYLDGVQFKKFVEYVSGPDFDEMDGADEDDGLDDGLDSLEETTATPAAGPRL